MNIQNICISSNKIVYVPINLVRGNQNANNLVLNVKKKTIFEKVALL